MTPGTEFARDFCAGIGPLQLGVVLVFTDYLTDFCSFGSIFLVYDLVQIWRQGILDRSLMIG